MANGIVANSVDSSFKKTALFLSMMLNELKSFIFCVTSVRYN